MNAFCKKIINIFVFLNFDFNVRITQENGTQREIILKFHVSVSRLKMLNQSDPEEKSWLFL